MSIPNGEFARQPDDQHEEEKIRHHSTVVLDQDENNGIAGYRGAPPPPPSNLLVLDDADDEAEATTDNIPQVHAPPVGIRPRHYPSSLQAPKPQSNSPMKLEEHLQKKRSFLPSFFSSSESSSPPPPKEEKEEGSPGPTMASDEKTTSNNEGYHDEQTNQSHQHNSISAASLVVCGVDGTVYTLDAYTGQLRGMFASGPALVFSSSPDEDTANKDNDADSSTNNDMDGQGDENSMNEHLNGDESNAITSNVLPNWKERVVPGLDGKLYSLIERVDGTTEVGENDDFEKCKAAYEGEYDDLDFVCGNSSPSGGSDGSSSSSNILPRLGTYTLTPLPISAMDVVDSPISTCRPKEGDTQQEQCGIIVGSKKTTIYAIDPTTGKVRWKQDPMGGGGGRGFTAHPPKTARGLQTVLLQREDFSVRNLDTDGGDEVWKVEVGRFSALDFDVDAGNNRGSGGRSSGGPMGGQDTSSSDDDILGGDAAAGGDHVVGGRRRGAAAAAASVGSKDKKKGVPPILGGRKKTSLHDFDSGFEGDRHGRKESLFEHNEDDFEHDQSLFRGFPSIAFGEDGTSLMAVDGISGELLWKRRIESVVAAVYGVGKESSWIRLDVIDESDVFTHGHSSAPQSGKKVGLLPPSSYPTASPHSGGLVPYGADQMESGNLHRLGRHHSNLFVSPKFDPLGGYDAQSLAEPGEDNLPYSADLDTPFLPQVTDLGHQFHPTDDRIFTINPPGMTVTDVKPPPSHILESGLYLTWSMVAAIVMILLSLVVFVARVIILRQKRKLENTPSLAPTTAPSSSEDGRERSPSSGGFFLPPAAQNLTSPSSGNIWTKNNRLPVTRSFSLNGLGSNSLGSLGTNVTWPFKGGVMSPPDLSATAIPKPSLGRVTSTPSTPNAVATTASPTLSRSKTLPTEESPTDDQNNQQRSRQPSIDNIDGIPLVRYSRYRCEFEVISPLGSGGFGTVFRCENTLDGRHYAIKKIKIISQSSMDGTVTKNFSQKLHRVLREVKILALLDHPNIVRYYTAWLETDDGIQNEDDETNTTSSMLDRKSQGIFSSSVFSGFGSTSRAMQTSFSPQRNIHQRPAKGFNPLGWNNFGSFRLDESKSEASSSFGAEQVDAPIAALCEEEEEDDLGFTWERSNEITVDPSTNVEKQTSRKLNDEMVKEEDSQSSSSSGISSVDSEESTDKRAKASTRETVTQSRSDTKKTVKLLEPKNDRDGEKKIMEGRHILFIQMQLCSVQTLGDFLSNRQARSGSVSQSLSHNSSYAVDIPFALRLFGQIANGVKYVHKQGLIHRDLKPQNCFIDDAGNVKVGDFGLSRESSTAGDITDFDVNGKKEIGHEDSFAPPHSSDAENTAGVGTRAYASPEQMRGSNYDASTDLYSLGIILFELCYPMYTSMERYKEFGGIRKGNFPAYWNSHVKTAFPTMHYLLVQMISDSAAERPSADAVSDHIDSLLREYSVQSLDKSWGKEGALLLRVEAEEKEGILAHAMKLIKHAAPQAKILQYGLRGQASRSIMENGSTPNIAIMEFAIEIEDDEKTASVENISSRLHKHDMTVRQIANS
mmetsp:Transcript_40719/g.73428  ORF Transcript_40719/g.73428 Transcript_40719/m.73428 type:complete len:1560 (-) Transcript_40719:951-5630(-)